MPEISGTDLNGPFETGEFRYSKNDFLTRMRRNGIKTDRLQIVEGFYSDSLPRFEGKDLKFSFVFIDCDLLESTREVLLFLKDKLVQGAIIAFDDYYCYSAPDLGERAAIREWLDENPSFELTDYNNFHWAGKSFVFYDSDSK